MKSGPRRRRCRTRRKIAETNERRKRRMVSGDERRHASTMLANQARRNTFPFHRSCNCRILTAEEWNVTEISVGYVCVVDCKDGCKLALLVAREGKRKAVCRGNRLVTRFERAS